VPNFGSVLNTNRANLIMFTSGFVIRRIMIISKVGFFMFHLPIDREILKEIS